MTSLKLMPVSGNAIRGIKPSLLEGRLRDLLEALLLKAQVPILMCQLHVQFALAFSMANLKVNDPLFSTAVDHP